MSLSVQGRRCRRRAADGERAVAAQGAGAVEVERAAAAQVGGAGAGVGPAQAERGHIADDGRAVVGVTAQERDGGKFVDRQAVAAAGHGAADAQGGRVAFDAVGAAFADNGAVAAQRDGAGAQIQGVGGVPDEVAVQAWGLALASEMFATPASMTPPVIVKGPLPKAELLLMFNWPAASVRPVGLPPVLPKVLAPESVSVPAPDFVKPPPAPLDRAADAQRAGGDIEIGVAGAEGHRAGGLREGVRALVDEIAVPVHRQVGDRLARGDVEKHGTRGAEVPMVSGWPASAVALPIVSCPAPSVVPPVNVFALERVTVWLPVRLSPAMLAPVIGPAKVMLPEPLVVIVWPAEKPLTAEIESVLAFAVVIKRLLATKVPS